MEPLALTNVLISVLIGLLGFIGYNFYVKLDKIEKDIQHAALGHVSMSKDIEKMKEELADHEKRIDKLESA